MPSHSKYFAPSSIHRRIACYGSARAEAEIPDDNKPKPAADWGTFAHHIAEKHFSGINVDSFLGTTKYGQLCTLEMLACVESFITDTHTATEGITADIGTEVRVELEGFKKHVYGTADIVAKELYGNIVILDYKSGRIPVDPVNNAQLMTYALCAGIDETIDTVKICVSQPRNLLNGKSLKIWETTPAVLNEWHNNTLKPTIKAILAGSNTRTPTDEGCQWCRARFQCRDLMLTRI